MNKKITIDTYDRNAKLFSDKFDKSGKRVKDIEEVFNLINKDNPTVLEIGCGNGRDAEEIIKHTDNYLGIDISKQFIKLAKQKLPHTKFEVADIENFLFQRKIDVIFAFASLIHIPKKSMQKILRKSISALNKNGIFRISLKYGDSYVQKTKIDEFGERTYYLYSKKDIEEMSAGFEIIKNELEDVRSQMWIEIILRKK